MYRILLLKPEKAFVEGRFERGIDLLVSNGRIEAIDREIEAPKDCRTIDLSGKILLPAMWDVHVHFFQSGIRMNSFDAAGLSGDSLFSAMSDWLEKHDEIDGYGLSPLRDGELPGRTELDRISKKKPIFIRRVDGHSSCANSAAIDIYGEKLPGLESSELVDGRFFGKSHIALDRFSLGRISECDLRKAAEAVAKNALSMGCANIGALVPNVRWMRVLLDMKLPVNVIPRLETLDPSEASNLGLSKVGGCMPMADGSFGSHSALLSKDYADRPGCRGTAEISQADLNRWFAEASKLRFLPAVHAIGDAAVDMVLNSIEALESDDRPQNPRIEHAELLRDDQIERIARMKISLAMQPVFEKLWGGPDGLYSRRLGERWRQTNRFRDLIDAGVIIAGSSDSYITPIDPLDGVFAAVNHPNPAQRVSLSEGIAMFSSMAARSEMLFDDRGSIQIGKSADFVVVSGDLDKRENISIEATIIGGEIVFENGGESDE